MQDPPLCATPSVVDEVGIRDMDDATREQYRRSLVDALPTSWRVVNTNDEVPKLPPAVAFVSQIVAPRSVGGCTVIVDRSVVEGSVGLF